MSWRASLLAVALATAVVPTFSYAQNQPGDGGGNGGGGRQRGNNNGGGGGGQRGGNMDPAAFMQQRMDRIKQELGAQEDEWKVIEPKLTKIMDAQRQVMSAMGRGMGGGRGGFGGGGGGGPGGGGNQPTPTTKVGIAAAELRKATEAESASPEDIDKKLTAYRAARKDAQDALEAARKDLKEMLTPKQEAVLVLNNYLE